MPVVREKLESGYETIAAAVVGTAPLMPAGAADNSGQYERGVIAGEIAQRLLEHDRHLDRVNGSMEIVAHRLTGVELALQRISDSMDADRVTVVKTAAALKDADDARRQKGERRWSPLARVAMAATTFAAILSGVAIILAHFKR